MHEARQKRQIQEAWEARKAMNPQFAQLEEWHEAGTIIVQQGEPIERPAAIYVIEGSLHEMLHLEDRGHSTNMIVNTIGVGGLAFLQGLYPFHAKKLPYLSVVAAERTRTASFQKQEVSETAGTATAMLQPLFQQSLMLIEHLKAMFAARCEEIDRMKEEQRAEIAALQADHREEISAFELEMRAYEDQLVGEQRRTEEQFDRAEREAFRAKEQQAIAKKIGLENRTLLESLDERYASMGVQATGMQLFVARLQTEANALNLKLQALRQHLKQLNVPNQSLQLIQKLDAMPNAEEMELMLGLMPENVQLEELKWRLMRFHAQLNFDDESVERAVDAIHQEPTPAPASVPPRPASILPQTNADGAEDVDVDIDWEDDELNESERGTLGEEPQRRTEFYGDKLPDSIPPGSLNPQKENPGMEELDSEGDRKTMMHDPYSVPGVSEPVPDQHAVSAPSPNERPPGWKPPPPARPTMVIHTGDPKNRR